MWDILSINNFLSLPTDKIAWTKIASDFERKWNLPNCLGAIHGKHVVIQAPPRSGSNYFNYIQTHSIVLLAVCDSNFEFLLVDIGDNFRQSDDRVYTNSHLGCAVDNLLNIPEYFPIQHYSSNYLFPQVFVADAAFSLKIFMFNPHPYSYQNDKSNVL